MAQHHLMNQFALAQDLQLRAGQLAGLDVFVVDEAIDTGKTVSGEALKSRLGHESELLRVRLQRPYRRRPGQHHRRVCHH